MGLRKSFSNSMNRGVTATNIVTNGNFSNGTTGWLISPGIGTFTVANDEASILTIAANGFLYQVPGTANIVGRKYYYRASVKSSSALVAFRFGITTTKYHSGSNLYETLSIVDTATSPTNSLNIVDTRASGWNTINIKNALAIDLTGLFGAGTEPTLAECDIIYADWLSTAGALQTLSPNSPLRN